MADPSLAVHDAVLAALVAAVAPVEVYDHVPANAAFPYVAMDRQIRTDDDDFTGLGDERLVMVSVWSEKRGQQEVLTILGQIKDALHNADLTLATGKSISCRVPDDNTSRDVDGKTYTGQATIRLLSAQ